MAQLDREFSERGKVETLLRELLDAKRNRKSEQLSDEQLALFAALWQARQTEREGRTLAVQKMTMTTKPESPASVQQLLGRNQVAARLCRGISSASASCAIFPTRKSAVPGVRRICVILARKRANVTNMFPLLSR